mmetsp:Transcript_46233/g.104182  ORF Transcript_46233/g.104182 Transcript_46233/m.104182 type:complete len:589 (-) Transcript_46233:606-2372(-)
MGCAQSSAAPQKDWKKGMPQAAEPQSTKGVDTKTLEATLSKVLKAAIAKDASDPLAFVAEELAKLAIASKHKGLQAKSQDAVCMLEHCSKLDIYSPPQLQKSTGIICTIGPKTKAPEVLTDLRKCGLNIVRMNFSHGSYEYHGEVVTAARTSVTDAPLDKRLVAIALDTKGPEIRTGLLKGGPTATIELVAGGTITVTTDPAFAESCDEQNLYMDYANLPKVVAVGGIIFVDDGLLALKVKSIDSATSLTCDVVNTASLGSKKGCNLPEVDVDLPALSEKDKKDLAWGVGQDVDMIFASFIRKASDVREVRKCLTDADPVVGKRIRIISKIENHEGMRNFDEILVETDGVMVARGDLGIEIPTEKVFLAQKMMIAKCNMAGKPVICATQMLESMTSNPRPTRAEASDVANAVLDGADCVMLSGETAKGKYPKEAVSTMASVCLEAEAALFHKAIAADMDMTIKSPVDPAEAVAKAVVDASMTKEAALIITLTRTGNSARLLSKFRPRCPILVLCRDAHVGAACNLHRGCIPFHYPKEDETFDIDARFAYAMELAKEAGLISAGDSLILAHGNPDGTQSLSDFQMALAA